MMVWSSWRNVLEYHCKSHVFFPKSCPHAGCSYTSYQQTAINFHVRNVHASVKGFACAFLAAHPDLACFGLLSICVFCAFLL